MGDSDILDKWFEASGHSKLRRHQFTENEFDAHVRAIGQMLLAWNDFHESLAPLFAVAVSGGGFIERHLALWHAVRSDLWKRQMLEIAISKMPPSELGTRTTFVADIEWIVKKSKELEGKRDDAAHTPLYHYESVSLTPVARALASGSGIGIFANTLWGNPRAERLFSENKNLIIEFENARKRLVILRDYALAISLAWSDAKLPWPDRPELPNPSPTKRWQSPDEERKPG